MTEVDSVSVTNDGTYRYANAGGSFTYRMSVNPEGENYLSFCLVLISALPAAPEDAAVLPSQEDNAAEIRVQVRRKAVTLFRFESV